jgi:DNA sulfur modification protein DndB
MAFDKFSSSPRKEEIDVKHDTFVQLAGVRGKQFGKDIYVAMMKFKDFNKFLESFPEVQRGISKSRVKDIKRYNLDAVESEEDAHMKFFNGITVTCRGSMIYDEDKRTVLIDTQSKLSINDGQHRVEGINEAIGELEKQVEKTTDLNDRREVENKLEQLQEMTIPVTIFDGIDESQEGQLFHDLNNLPRRPSRNANIRLSQTDLFARMANDIAVENRYFSHYGVETDKQFVNIYNDNTFLLSTIYGSIRELLAVNIGLDRRFLKKRNYDRVKNEVNQQFERILEALPSDMDAKRKYIIEKSYALVGICKFVSYANENILFADKEDIYKVIKENDWSYKNPDWIKYGGIKGKGSNVIFSASGAGIKAIFNVLVDKAVEYNEKKEKSYLKN